MRQTIALLFFGMLASGPIVAKHWHEDDKHWKKYKDHDEHHARDVISSRETPGL